MSAARDLSARTLSVPDRVCLEAFTLWRDADGDCVRCRVGRGVGHGTVAVLWLDSQSLGYLIQQGGYLKLCISTGLSGAAGEVLTHLAHRQSSRRFSIIDARLAGQ